MGMYTELNLGVSIENNKEVISVLEYMLNNDEVPKIPNHKLFESVRWKYMLTCGSYYFSGRTDSKLFKDELYPNDPMYFLNVRCNLKNYESEIENFLDWLCPYIETNGFLGYMRYEEDEKPTLIYKKDEKIEYEILS